MTPYETILNKMNARYDDIKSRIKEKPKWYDMNGAPRYDKFHPDLSPNIYADEVILMEIGCQGCSERFMVEMNWSTFDNIFKRSKRLSKRVRSLHYGDPPHHDDPMGNTMNCIDIRVVEFWIRKKFDWKRYKKFEIRLDDN